MSTKTIVGQEFPKPFQSKTSHNPVFKKVNIFGPPTSKGIRMQIYCRFKIVSAPFSHFLPNTDILHFTASEHKVKWIMIVVGTIKTCMCSLMQLRAAQYGKKKLYHNYFYSITIAI